MKPRHPSPSAPRISSALSLQAFSLFCALCAPCALNAQNTRTFTNGEDYTADYNLASRTDTFIVHGADTATLSGRLLGTLGGNSIASGGAFIKEGAGTLAITGSLNWFRGPNTIASGTLVVTHVGALGRGHLAVNPGATFVFNGIRDGDHFANAITGGGRVEVTDSDMALGYRGSQVINAPAASDNNFSSLNVTRSRLFMLASGTLATGLGGGNSIVTIAGHSTLALGREGVSAGVSGLLAPASYPILARTLTVDATSALILHPGANLTITGTLTLTPGSTLLIGAAGFARLEYASLGSADPDAHPDTLATVPAGYTLATTSLISAASRPLREYLAVNQGANPMHDTAMTAGAIDTIAATVSSRLNELFLQPTTEPSRTRQARKWANTAWIRYIHSRVDFDAKSASLPGHNGNLGGLILGMDSAYRNRINYGFYGAVTKSTLDTTNATTLLSSQRYLGLSATPRLKNCYITADLFAGNADSESLRREMNGETIAKWNNSFFGGGIEIGAILRPAGTAPDPSFWKNTTLRPRAGLRYTRLEVNGYHERAPIGASPVVLADLSDTLAHLNLGVEATRRFNPKWLKRDTLVGASLGFKHYLREPRATLATHYRDYPDHGFTLARGDYYEDTLSAGASLGMTLTWRTRAGLALTYERGSNHNRLTANFVLNCVW